MLKDQTGLQTAAPAWNGTVIHDIQLPLGMMHHTARRFILQRGTSVKKEKLWTTKPHRNRHYSLAFFKLFQILTMWKPKEEHASAWQSCRTPEPVSLLVTPLLCRQAVAIMARNRSQKIWDEGKFCNKLGEEENKRLEQNIKVNKNGEQAALLTYFILK